MTSVTCASNRISPPPDACSTQNISRIETRLDPSGQVLDTYCLTSTITIPKQSNLCNGDGT
ncbi:Protein of unknown function [Pyronema omphalodes CBS 100304]|uniref:Uncharacterized protein n=1 Tax=Pyronema omphalodes (strain CBS 100304) TaxID=1076935 RepID=U4LQ06_PYROM|nr:Protein of unknown function [Pyronema omphalodes CBS 100304]